MLGHIDPNQIRVKAWATTVYVGFDNVTSARFVRYDTTTRRDVPLDFSQLTRVRMTFPEVDPALVFDSLQEPGAFDWTGGDGTLRFNLSTFAVPEGSYRAEIVVYDLDHVRGQVLVTTTAPRDGLTITFDHVGVQASDEPQDAAKAIVVSRVAGETVSALRVVYDSADGAYLLDPVEDDARALLGLAITGGTAGGDISVQRSGLVVDSGWDWAVGPVFLGPEGTLTQVEPAEGWEVVVGWAPSATRLNLFFDEPVYLA